MAEIRINATGGLKLYDADDSHYAQILAGTISSNVDALTLGSSSADFNIPVKVLGTTPTLTIGDAGAEDTKIVFDGNAQDYYVGLDDSSDSLVLGLGSTLGTTPAMTVNSSQVVTFAQNPVFPDGGVAVADLDIDGATDIGAAIVDADLLIIDDGAGGTNRKTAASRLKTYIGGGITEYDQWRTTTETTGSQDPVDNWERVDTDSFEHIGSGMTESSGVFTFPSTGKWVIHTMAMVNGNTDSRYNDWAVHLSTDSGSSYSSAIYCSQFVVDTIGSGTVSSMSGDSLFDVTNASTFRVKLVFGRAAATVTLVGATSTTNCAISFMRIGDT